MAWGKSLTSPYTAPYWNYRNEISIYDGIMFKGEKVIVPKSMQREMLTLIDHSSQKSRMLYQNAKEPKRTVALAPNPPKTLGLSWSRFIWTKFTKFHCTSRLLFRIYWSRTTLRHQEWSHNQTMQVPVRALWCPRYSCILVTDNGPQFSKATPSKTSPTAMDFSIVLAAHTTHSRMAELRKLCRLSKALSRKPRMTIGKYTLYFWNSENTPINDQLKSPVQRLMGRRTKTLLPTSQQLLIPKKIEPAIVHSQIKEQQKDKNSIMINTQSNSQN